MANADDPLTLGFLTAVDLPGGGHVGGLLMTDRLGRPLEFQCTTPVRPDRTQQILYGPTLVPYLLGEVIGGTLVKKAGVKPNLVLCDSPAMLSLRPHTDRVVARVEGDAGDSLETHEAGPNGGSALSVGCRTLHFHPAHGADRQFVADCRDRIPEHADLSEPFERVREALSETCKSVAA
ncbi:MAG: hypothetical protein AAF907_06095 [Planctomycetota bacterium]